MQLWVRSGHRNHQRNSDDTIAWKVLLSTSVFYQPTNRNCARLLFGKNRLEGWGDSWRRSGSRALQGRRMARWPSDSECHWVPMLRWWTWTWWVAEFTRFTSGGRNAHVLHGKLENCVSRPVTSIWKLVSWRDEIIPKRKDINLTQNHSLYFTLFYYILVSLLWGHKIKYI